MRVWFLRSFVGFTLACSLSRAAERIGLQNVRLGDGERVSAFTIQVGEARIRSITDVPEGWTLTVQNFGETGLDKNGGAEVRGRWLRDHRRPDLESPPSHALWNGANFQRERRA